MANVQYPAGKGALAQAALPAAQGIQPADELAARGAQAAGGQVAQVVQQVVGQEALQAAERVAKATHIRSVHVNKLSLLAQLPFGEGCSLSVPNNFLSLFYGERTLSCGKRSFGSSRLTSCSRNSAS